MRRAFVPLACAALLTTPAWAVELTVWVHPDFSPSAGLQSVADAYKAAYAEFEKENPDITIRYEVERGGTEALQQFLTAASSNTLPDLALLDGFWISRLVETGKLQPLNDLWSADSRAHWLPASVDAVTLDGRTGTAIGRDEPNRDGEHSEIVIDPDTGAYLGSRTLTGSASRVLPKGAVLDSSAVTTSVVDSVPAD